MRTAWAVAACLMAFALPSAGTTTPPSPHTPSSLPACQGEGGNPDRMPCYWNAWTQGNGRGQSFIITTSGRTHLLGASR